MSVLQATLLNQQSLLRPLQSSVESVVRSGAGLRMRTVAPLPNRNIYINSKRTAVAQPTAQGSNTFKSDGKSYTLTQPAGESRYEVAPGQKLEFLTAGAQAFIRFGSAAFVSPTWKNFRKRPAQPLELYEFEGCPFCRKVREAVTILDLDVIFYPCPQGGPTWRPKAKQLSGKGQFPFLVDPNNGKSMLESDDIIDYLWEEYGDGKANIPLALKLGPLTTITAGVALLPRGGRGSRYRKSKLPKEPIIIWAYEASPFCKLAREVLCELELPHLWKSVARNSPKRAELIAKHDVFQVPYIEDPNTGIAMFETKPIIDYFEKTYGA